MKIKPCGDRILIKLRSVEEKSTGGIVLHAGSDLEREKYAQTEAEVVALGPDAYREFEGNWCEVGDHVLVTRYAGEAKTDPDTGEIYRVINDVDVLGIIS